MSVLIKCDKCGKTDEATKFIYIEAHKLISATKYNTAKEKSIDVCKECYKNFFKQGD